MKQDGITRMDKFPTHKRLFLPSFVSFLLFPALSISSCDLPHYYRIRQHSNPSKWAMCSRDFLTYSSRLEEPKGVNRYEMRNLKWRYAIAVLHASCSTLVIISIRWILLCSAPKLHSLLLSWLFFPLRGSSSAIFLLASLCGSGETTWLPGRRRKLSATLLTRDVGASFL